MATRKIKDAKDFESSELIYFKGHAKATYMSDGRNVEDAINQIDAGGGITDETDPIFSASPAASITEAKKTEWDNKVDKVSGKGLSTEDFTSALKTKLEGLNNYDDTELSEAMATLRQDFDKLVSGDTTTAIKTFNEVIDFLDGIQDTQDLSSIIASIEQQIAGKQDKITDLDTIRSGAAKGATALQSYTEQYKGTVTGVKVNGATKSPSNGIVDIGTVITAHQDISGKADKSSLATVATSGSYNDLSNKPTIPSAVTESTVSGWGFTKNTGTYSKPSGGIPKTDLASGVQNTLDAIGSYGVIIDDINADVAALYENKQDTLVSGNTIKTINGESILGSGNIVISGGGSSSGGGEVYITPFTVDQFCAGSVELTDEQRDELLNAASQNRIIGMPHGRGYLTGFVIVDYGYLLEDLEGIFWRLELGVIYNGAHYSNYISSNDGDSNFIIHRRTITPFKPLIYTVTAEDGVATVSDDTAYTDNCVFAVFGECSELCVYLEPSEIGKTVRFFTGGSCTLEIGAYVYWANGEVPTIEPYTQYELSLVGNIDYCFNAVLTPFKPVE